MPLLDLKTNLKDLKFGNDERGGGNSGQPYVATRIPATNEALQTGFSGTALPLLGAGAGAAVGAIGGSVLGASGTGAIIGAVAGLGAGLIAGSQQGDSFKTPTSGTGGPDFLLRGGTLLPNAIADDVTRLGKFFASTEGILFTVKQNLLSRLAVKTQVSPKLLNGDVYTPISSLIEAAGVPFGIHVNKQGLNPFEETGAYSVNENLYGVRIKSTQPQSENRLIGLYGAKFLIPSSDLSSIPDIFLKNNISDDPFIVLSYEGGPNAPLGIGKTKIRAAGDLSFKLDPKRQLENPGTNYLTYGYYDLNTETLRAQNFTDTSIFGFGNTLPIVYVTDTANVQLNNPRNVKTYIPSVNQMDFRYKLIDIIKKNKENKEPNDPSSLNTLISKSPNYNPSFNQTIEQRVKLGDPGNATGKDVTSYTNGIGEGNSVYKGAASENSFDKINALPLYKSSTPSPVGNDLINFRIGVLDNDKPGGDKVYIHFRAFLNQISDQYTAGWDATKYIGRGENFYNYTGFDRKVSLSWTVAAQSKVELIPMYKKLNYLASICAPDYNSAGYMRGNIVTLTIGGYFYEQPGIITSINYEMNDDNASWEIAIDDDGNKDESVKQLPHLIKVTGFEFIPIHTFVPRKQKNKLNWNASLNRNVLQDGYNTYGGQRYIALANGTDPKTDSNYGEIYDELVSNPSPPPLPPPPPPPPPPPTKINTPRYG